MTYDPRTVYRGDQWIAQGGQMWAGIASQLIGDLISRGRRKEELLGTLSTYDRGQPDEEDQGDEDQTQPAAPAAPAAGAPATTPTSGGGFNPAAAGAGVPAAAVQKGKQADAIRNLAKAYHPDNTDLHQSLKAMSVDQLEGMLKGYTMSQVAEEHRAKMADFNAQALLRRQQAQSDMETGRAVARYADFIQRNSQPPSESATEGTGEGAGPGMTPMTPQELHEGALAAALSGGASGRNLGPILRGLSSYMSVLSRGGVEGAPGFVKSPAGQWFATFGKGMQKAGASEVLRQAKDENGQPIANVMLDVNGNMVHTRHGPLSPATDAMTGEVMPGIYMDSEGKAHDFRTEEQKATGGGTAATYKTAQDVRDAVNSKKITRAQGLKILQDRFNYK